MNRGLIFILAVFATGFAAPDPAAAKEKDPPPSEYELRQKELHPLPDWAWKKSELKRIADLAGQVTRDTKGHSLLETEHWFVETELSEQFTAEAAVYMEIFYAAFQDVFYFKVGVDLPQKPTFHVYSTRKNYLLKSGAPQWTGGIFQFGWKSKTEFCLDLHVYAEVGNGNPSFTANSLFRSIIQHEGTHCLLAQLLGGAYIRFPVWLNEGMATYYEYWDLRYKASESGNLRRDMAERKERLERSPTPGRLAEYFDRHGNRPPDLADLLSLTTQKQWSEDLSNQDIALHYALAESFADFMICSKARRALLKTIFERFAAKEPLLADAEIPTLEKDWHKCLRERWDIDLKRKKKSAK